MKFHLLWAVIALLCMAAVGFAQDAPPPCVGDNCSPTLAPAVPTSHLGNPATLEPQRSVLVKRVRVLPRVREAQPARKLAGATCKIARYGLKGGARVVLLPFRCAKQAACNCAARIRQRVSHRGR